ncbi:hypothetical protein UlMin_005143 [Ulmus minor]
MPLFSLQPIRILTITLLIFSLSQLGHCLSFDFPKFQDLNDFIKNNSYAVQNAIQVTPDLSDITLLYKQSGRSLFKKPFKLWRRGKGNSTIRASFNSTFILNISPYPGSPVPTGDGLSFILTGNPALPEESYGQWLGIVNARTNGSLNAQTMAIEFDTKKSFQEDLDDNHVGLDLNSVYSITQVSLTGYGLNLSSGRSITVNVQYDGKNISVFASWTNQTSEKSKDPILTWPVDLSKVLPDTVYVGFSGSTGDNHTERNCVLAWDFHSSEIKEGRNLSWVWITIPILAVLLVGLALYLYCARPCWKEDPEEAYLNMEERLRNSSMAPKNFRLSELRRATGNFSDKNKLGRGGFGTVYKGFLGNKEVAVKRVSKESRQGKQEFIAEVTTIGSLSHRNLVKLIGWCYESHELLIVYEFMPNGSLDRFIFGDEKLGFEMSQPGLSWERRHGIVCGVAQALDYLHNGCEKRVLHRDIKSSNIMLDSEFNAKLGDFGLARMIQQSEKTHHTTNEIAGTPGYMAPESFLTGRATIETDVYAFGVLVIEVLSGRKPVQAFNETNSYNNSIVHWLWAHFSKGAILEAVDPRLNENFDEDEMGCLLVLGLACCHPNPHERPSMRTILKVLTGEADPPMVPIEIPAFVWPSSMPASFKVDGDTTQGGQITPFTELTGR